MKKYLVGIALLLPLLAGCSEKKESNALQQLPLDIAAGKAIAQQVCSSCHGMDGRGVADNIPNLASQIEAYLINAVQKYDHGKRSGSSDNAMNIAQQFSPSQLRNVLGYYASLPPLRDVEKKSADYSFYNRGKELNKPCLGCHGSDGNPSKSGVPRLAGQHPQYLVTASKAFKNGTRTVATAHDKLSKLSQSDMENLAIFFALNKPKPIASKVENPYEGKQFANNCAKCHGATGSSDDATVPNLSGQDPQYLVMMIKAYRDKTNAQSEMHKAINGFKDGEIEKLAAFFAAELPTPLTFSPPDTVDSLALLCDRCHNLGSSNTDMLTPKLKGQHRTYLINAMIEYRDGDRGSTAMHKISSVFYFDASIEGIATHYAAQPAN